MTRSFISLAHGQWKQAWQFNSAGVFFFAVILGQVPYRSLQIWRIRRGKKEIDGTKFSWVLWLLVLVMLGQWMVRVSEYFL